MNANLIAQIKQLRKVELHRHIEGSISPELFYELAKKYDKDGIYNDFSKVQEFYNYSDFMGFLNAYSIVVSYLRDYEDFKMLAKTVISQLKQDNIVYSELIFSPQLFIKNGLDSQRIFQVMFDEFNKSNIKTSIIIDLVRNFGTDEAMKTLPILNEVKESSKYLNNWIKAISIGGDEVNYPAKLFKDVFQKAKEFGFILYAHAGEWVDSTSIWDALNILQVKRIGHGIQSINDDKLIDYLLQNKIGLDISITSNYFTNAIESITEHPVKELFNRGISISLNTDDPGFFRTDLNKEFLKFCEMGFKIEDLRQIQVSALNNAFIKESEKLQLLKLLKED